MAAVNTAANNTNNIKQPTAMVSRHSASVNMRAALAYAQKLGWAVIPLHSIVSGCCSCGDLNCDSPGKHPRTSHGKDDATKDPATIRAWWTRWPNANIGVITGTKSGFFVMDIDGEEGRESLEELEATYGPLPETVEQITGSGGRHILFKQPEGIYITGHVRKFPGIDFRGEGNYIVAAPSNHISGQRYCWEVEHHPLEMQIADAPQWLLELIGCTQGTEDAGATPPDEWAKMLDGLIEGQRNNSLYRYACHLLAHGLSAVETVKLVRALNKAYSKPPLQDKEVDSLLKSAIEWRSER